MRRVSRSWDYLREWDINYLTGEACGVGIRGRVDVGPKGEELIDEFLGGVTLKYDGWNKSDWKTMMMPDSMAEDLVVFALLREYDIVLRVSGKFILTEYHAVTKEEWENEYRKIREHWDELGFAVRSWSKMGNDVNGLMNRHFWSGRLW